MPSPLSFTVKFSFSSRTLPFITVSLRFLSTDTEQSLRSFLSIVNVSLLPSVLEFTRLPLYWPIPFTETSIGVVVASTFFLSNTNS